MEQKICKNCEQPVQEKIPPCPLQCGSPKCRSYQPKLFTTSKPIIWMLGGPGSGKGTQCTRIVKKYNFAHISTGELLRAEVAKQTELGKQLQATMNSGTLVSDSVVLGMMAEAIKSAGPEYNGYLIDGYPRHQAQAIEFCRVIRAPDVIIFLEASANSMKARLLQRAVKENRADDNDITITARLKTFFTCSEQVLSVHPDLVRRIPGDDPPDEIFNRIEVVLAPLVSCYRSNRSKFHSAH